MDGIDKIDFNDHSATAWGGINLIKDLLDATRVKEQLDKLSLPEKGSNRGYDPSQILERFWTSIWIGAGRYSHSSYLRYNNVSKKILGWKEAPSQSNYSRLANLTVNSICKHSSHYSTGFLIRFHSII